MECKRERHFRRLLLRKVWPASRAMLRSQSGKRSAAALTAIPADAYRRMQPERFRVLLCASASPSSHTNTTAKAVAQRWMSMATTMRLA